MNLVNKLISLLLAFVLIFSTVNYIISEEIVEESEISTPSNEYALSSEQLNSVNMLNHLTVLTQAIINAKNNRLFMEETYSNLINNTNPKAVDMPTRSQLFSLLDTLEGFRMTALKRERLDFLYQQNRAERIRAAIPNPLVILSAVHSDNILKTLGSLLYLATDSISSYQAKNSQIELKYLQDGWQLDQEASDILHGIRKENFGYMLEIVQTYGLNEDMALTEKLVEDFVSWKNNENIQQRIHFLESNQENYRAMGAYWLTLAETYFQASLYDKCLEAISSYEELKTNIYRKDYEFAKILIYGIQSAREELDSESYVTLASEYCGKIIKNINYDDWTASYFVAQTYLDLFSLTNNTEFLNKAFDLSLNNVNILVNKQKELNRSYLTSLVKIEPKKDAAPEEKKDIEQYNKMQTEIRKKELPPVYQPLLLNLELLFSLAEELKISETKKQKIDNILASKDNSEAERLFLTLPLDLLYRKQDRKIEEFFYDIQLKKGVLQLPAQLISDNTKIRLIITDSSKHIEQVIEEDWEVEKVERKKDNALDSINVFLKSEIFSKATISEESKILLEILNGVNEVGANIKFEFIPELGKKLYIFDDVKFRRVK